MCIWLFVQQRFAGIYGVVVIQGFAPLLLCLGATLAPCGTAVALRSTSFIVFRHIEENIVLMVFQ